MSRREKLIKEKEKSYKLRKKLRILFIFIMMINVSVGVYIVRKSANDMMGIQNTLLINQQQLNSIKDKIYLNNMVNMDKVIKIIENFYKNRT